MKKYLIILFLLCTLSISAADNSSFYKWSISLEGGLNRFDGDVNQTLINTFPASVWSGSYGLAIGRSFTNVYGVSASGYYLPLRATTYLNGVEKNIRTNALEGSLNGTVDISRLLFPNNTSKFSLNGAIGIGYSFYVFNLNPALTMVDKSFIMNPSPGIVPSFPVTDTYGLAFTLPVSLSINYNVSDKFVLGIKTTYISYSKDNLEGIWSYKGVTNDRVGIVTASLTYKFGKNKSKFKAVESPNIEESPKLHKDSLYHRNIFDNNLFGGNIIQTPSENILSTDTTQYEPMISDNYNSIFFDFDKYDLDNAALQSIYKISRILEHDVNLKVKIIGYCDYIGGIPYNFVLSEKRTEITKRELISKYGINSNRIFTDGKGKLNNPKEKYRPNRRCDFIFYY